MNRSFRIVPILSVAALALGALLLWAPGCRKAETPTEAEQREAIEVQLAPSQDVTDADRARAAENVKKIRDSLAPLIQKTYKPPAKELGFYLDVAALTRFDHRLSGYGSGPNQEPTDAAGSIPAAHYVADRLKAMGVRRVVTQRFPLVQPLTKECKLIVDGKEYPIYEMRPNVLQAPVTPAEGLTGQTLYAKSGQPAEYGSVLPENRIVVLNMDCEKNWLKAFAFGARAVLFIGQEEAVAKAYHHVNVPANLPRFYVPAKLAETLALKTRSREVTIKAACRWTPLHGMNVIAKIPGTDPEIPIADQQDPPPQAIVLAAALDSYSEVPRLSPGARDAGNAAALLHLAEALHKQPPRRDIILCFFDGQYQGHRGARTFYGALFREKATDTRTIQERYAGMASEARLRKNMIAFYEAFAEHVRGMKDKSYPKDADEEARGLFPDALANMPDFKAAITSLQNEARALSGEMLAKVRPLRIARRELEQDLKADRRRLPKVEAEIKDLREKNPKAEELRKKVDEAEGLRKKIPEIKALLPQMKAEIEAAAHEDIAWNWVLRDIFKEVVSQKPKERDEVFDRFKALLKDNIALQRRRLTELDVSMDYTQDDARAYHAFGPDSERIVLHLSINLGDARPRWTFIHGDDSIVIGKDTAGNYTRAFRAIRKAYGVLGPDKSPGFYPLAAAQKWDSRTFAAGRFADSTGVARCFAIHNLAVMTVLDPMPRQGQPADTPAALDVKTMAAQVMELPAFLRLLADDTGLPVKHRIRTEARYDEIIWDVDKGTPSGPSVKRASAGGGMRTGPVRDGIVAMAQGHWTDMLVEKVPPGFGHAVIVPTNANGHYETGAVNQTNYGTPTVFAARFDDRGLITSATSADTIKASAPKTATVQTFPTRQKTLVDYGADRGTVATTCMRARSTSTFMSKYSLVCESGPILTLFAPDNVDAFKLFHKSGMVLLVNELAADKYLGTGMSLDDPFAHPVAPLTTAHDLHVLNGFRLQLLRRVRINQASLEDLNGEGQDLVARGREKLERLAEGKARGPSETADNAVGDFCAATGYFRRTYAPLMSVLNDLVAAVVLLLLMAIPFAYALERLLIGTPHIYRQIGGFAAFFLLTFAVLFFVNPAFKIASTPIIIFLAFTIILLSSLVIVIMIRKLQVEVRRMQGLAATVHSADVSRLGTMLAAVNMGISTMRRRPVRTFLTATTVVLLTFTILTFASFGTTWGVGETYESPLPGGPNRLLVRHPLWNPLGEGGVDTVRGHLAGEATVVPRYWLSPTAAEVQAAVKEQKELGEIALRGDLGGEIVPLAGAIGISPEDLKQQKLARFLDGRVDLLAADGIFLTEAVRDWLKLEAKDVGKTRIIFAGHLFTYAGVVQYAFHSETMLDGSSWLPVDYRSSGMGEQQQTTASDASAELSESAEVVSHQFVEYTPDDVVLISQRRARDMGAQVRALCIYPKDPSKTAEIGRRVATVVGLPVYAGRNGGVFRLRFAALTEASGWRDLLIPVLLGGMIVFATMLGSVSDREREIYTFSSLGLAPPHIASLFFAEASVYAIVGGMGGYLLGQVIARALGWLSSLGYLSVPTMNYSSTNAIVTIVIVMGTVMISTIYPALKASRSANPGIQRAWQIPAPEGNIYDLTFPFTVSAYDIVGVVSFLKEHFDNYSDTSLGVFATTDSAMFRQQDNDMLGIQATMALAPFDLGVNQQFAMLSRPSEIEGIDEVRILIHRASGARGDWQRSNRVFINDLRRQLLIWRSLPDDVMDKYRQQTLELWDSLPVQQVTPENIGAHV